MLKAVNSEDSAVHKCTYLWLRGEWEGRWVSRRLTLRFSDVTLAQKRHHEDPERGHDFVRICSAT